MHVRADPAAGQPGERLRRQCRLIDVYELWRPMEQMEQGVQGLTLFQARHEEDVLPGGQKLIELPRLLVRFVERHNDLSAEPLTLDGLPHGPHRRGLDA